MKLTVGPLPSAVYWRRRAILLGGMLVAVSLVWASCSTASRGERAAQPGPSASTSIAPSAPASTLLTPTVDGLESPTTGASPQPAAPPAQPAGPPPGAPVAAVPACADTELLLTPMAAQTTAPRGAIVKLTLKVKNISPHACSRDLGADQQELYIQQGTVKVWSSDACDPHRGVSVRNLAPNEEQAFFVDWSGRISSAGCEDAQRVPPPPGKYQIFGRLATKISDPVVLTLT